MVVAASDLDVGEIPGGACCIVRADRFMKASARPPIVAIRLVPAYAAREASRLVMVAQDQERIVASLFAPDVAVACLDAAALLPDSSFPHEPWFTQATPSRQREFAGGRACASRALVALGMQPELLPRGSHGEPIWPPGVVGSITHTDTLWAAVAGRASDVGALGVDVEPDRPETTAFARRICSDAELLAIRELGAPIESLAPVAFSAKEAAYKLQFQLTGDAGAWGGIEVLLGRGTFTARFEGAQGLARDTLVFGRWRRALGLIWAGVALHTS